MLLKYFFVKKIKKYYKVRRLINKKLEISNIQKDCDNLIKILKTSSNYLLK